MYFLSLAPPPPPPHGMDLAKDIRDRERGGRAQVTVVEAEDEKSSEEAVKLMKQHLGERRDIRDGIVSDDVVDSKLRTSIKLFQSVPCFNTFCIGLVCRED